MKPFDVNRLANETLGRVEAEYGRVVRRNYAFLVVLATAVVSLLVGGVWGYNAGC